MQALCNRLLFQHSISAWQAAHLAHLMQGAEYGRAVRVIGAFLRA